MKGENAKLKSGNCEWLVVVIREHYNLSFHIRDFHLYNLIFRENRVSTEDKFHSEASGPSNKLFLKVLNDFKDGV